MGTAATLKERVGNRHVVFFDGVCNLCNGFVNYLIDHDSQENLLFASLQSTEANQLLPAEITATMDSVVLLAPDGKIYRESAAVLKIAGLLGGMYRGLAVFAVLPVGVRDRLYKWVAANRYRWFGKKDVCRVPTPELAAKFV